MDSTIRRLVRQRAGDRCEYCGLRQSAAPLAIFHIEHVIATQHGGTDEFENLALACYHCNLHKGPNIAGIDPESGDIIALFNPRLEQWDGHFERWGTSIAGKTPKGRATIKVLAMNGEEIRQLRAETE